MAIGAAIAVVGAGVIVAIVDPGSNPQLTRTSTAFADGLGTGDSRSFVLYATATDRATFSLVWLAGGLMSVELYNAYSCRTPPCITYPAIVVWPGDKNGSWSATGTAASEYELVVEPAGAPNGTFNFVANFTEKYRSEALSLPLMAFAVTMAGGSVLAGIGGVLLYLGLFLPAGVYRTVERTEPGGAAGISPRAPSGDGDPAGPGAPGRSR